MLENAIAKTLQKPRRASDDVTSMLIHSLPNQLNRLFRHALRYFLVVTVCLCVWTMSGCVESYFNLAKDSRLPAGMIIPPGLTRADVSVTMEYHTLRTVKFTMRDKKGKKLATSTGRMKNREPLHLKNSPQDYWAYPSYDVVVVRNVTEILEQRQQNNILYVTDDPAIKQEMLADQGGR